MDMEERRGDVRKKNAETSVLMQASQRHPGVQLTLITRDLSTPYSGMLPGKLISPFRVLTPLAADNDSRPLWRTDGPFSPSVNGPLSRFHRRALFRRRLSHRFDPLSKFCRGPFGPQRGAEGRGQGADNKKRMKRERQGKGRGGACLEVKSPVEAGLSRESA